MTKAIDFDPQFGHDHANLKDYAVVLLRATVDVRPVELPTAGLLDKLAAQGALRPDTVFDNVGYGFIPSFKAGPPDYADPPGRMYSTSLFQALTPSYLRLLMNSDAQAGNGGVCFGDQDHRSSSTRPTRPLPSNPGATRSVGRRATASGSTSRTHGRSSASTCNCPRAVKSTRQPGRRPPRTGDGDGGQPIRPASAPTVQPHPKAPPSWSARLRVLVRA